jgi:hypothetical protein
MTQHRDVLAVDRRLQRVANDEATCSEVTAESPTTIGLE